MGELFSKLVSTLAVILVMAGFISGSDLYNKILDDDKSWKYPLFSGLLGGLFGIYGNLSGTEVSGAVISVRDIGPMLAGLTGGPAGGLIGGLICGIHRYSMGGITAQACVLATLVWSSSRPPSSIKAMSGLRSPFSIKTSEDFTEYTWKVSKSRYSTSGWWQAHTASPSRRGKSIRFISYQL